MNFDGHQLKHDFAVADLGEFSCAGLLGNDFFSKHQVGISYAAKSLIFPWGHFPLSHASDVERFIQSIDAPTGTWPVDKKLRFSNCDEVRWCSPPHEIAEPCSSVDTEVENPTEVTAASEVAISKVRLALPLEIGVFLREDAYHLVLLKADAPPGTPLIIHGQDIGIGSDPEPTFTVVGRHQQVAVMFKSTGLEMKRLTQERLDTVQVEKMEPEINVMLVNATWEQRILEPEMCPVCGQQEASSGEVCAACEAQIIQQSESPAEEVLDEPKVMSIEEKLNQFDLSEVPIEHLQQFRELLTKHIGAFVFPGEPLGHFTEFEFEIDTGKAHPVKHRPYRLAFAHREFVEKTIKDLLDQGIIYPSTSEWAAPLLLVPKKAENGKTGWRAVIDFRGLNRVTKAQVYPYPVVQDVLDELQGRPFRFCLDISSSYWQCEVEPASRHKTAFVCHMGQFEWARVPFGLKNAGTHFCKMIGQVFGGYLRARGLISFVDDLAGSGPTYEDTFDLLDDTLTVAVCAGIRFNPNKCQFLKHAMIFLGHVISATGVQPDPAKVKCVLELPPPGDTTGVRSFMGMMNFYKKFIIAFAEIARPLFCLTSGDKKRKIEWKQHHQAAFDALKNALISAPCLAYPDFNLDFHLVVYGDKKGIGATLQQRPTEDADRHPIAFFSAKLNPAQQRYSEFQIECYAIVQAVEHFRLYLEGRRFHLYSRQASLKWLFNEAPTKPTLARWVLRLQAFEFTIHNEKGARNPALVHARALLPPPTEETAATPLVEVTVNTVVQRVDCRAPELDMEELRLQQVADPLWKVCVEKLRDQKIELPNYVLDGRGLLYKRDGQRVRLCVPAEKRAAVINHFHSSVWGAHWGTAKMVASLSERFYWPGLRDDVEEHVGSCLDCLLRKPAPTLKPPLQLANAEAEKGVTWSIDIVGPLPVTSKGNKYILTAVDAFTRYPEACAIPDQKAITVVDALVKMIITRYGHIRHLVTDQGSQFTSGLLAQVCAFLNIKHRTTSAYNPKANMVESMYRSLGDFLSIFTCGDEEQEWDDLLPFGLLALRASVHSSTGFSPALLMTGQPISMPWDDLVEPAIVFDKALQLSHAEYLALMKADLWLAKEEAHRRDLGSKLRSQQSGPQGAFPVLRAGDLVLIRNLGHRGKLDPRWKGPYVVLKKLSPLTFELQHKNTGKIVRFHASHLRELRREPRPSRVYVAKGINSPDKSPERGQPPSKSPFSSPNRPAPTKAADQSGGRGRGPGPILIQPPAPPVASSVAVPATSQPAQNASAPSAPTSAPSAPKPVGRGAVRRPAAQGRGRAATNLRDANAPSPARQGADRYALRASTSKPRRFQ